MKQVYLLHGHRNKARNHAAVLVDGKSYKDGDKVPLTNEKLKSLELAGYVFTPVVVKAKAKVKATDNNPK